MQSKDEFHFHEDFDGEITVIDSKNEFLAKWQFVSLDQEVLRNPFKEMDSETVFKRNSNLLTSAGLKIRMTDLDSVMSLNGLQKISRVYSGYGGSYNDYCKNMVAYGTDKEAILVEAENEWVSSIGLVSDVIVSEGIKEKFEKALSEIGSKWGLTIIYWNKEIAIDMSKSENLADLFTYAK
jgi:hypothetical protein